MLHHVRHRDAVEVKNLAARENGRKNLVLFRGGQNEHCVRRRLFQGLQKRIECRLGQHVHLVDDVHLVIALLRGDTHLVNNGANVFHFVVRRRIQFKDVECVILLVIRVKPIDGSSENSGGRCLAHPARSTEQIRLRNLLLLDRLLERSGDAVLPDHGIPMLRSVLPCRDGILRLLCGVHRSCEYRMD